MDDQSQKEIKQKIEKIHQQCEEELSNLQKEQDLLISEFVAECEKENIEKLKNKLE